MEQISNTDLIKKIYIEQKNLAVFEFSEELDSEFHATELGFAALDIKLESFGYKYNDGFKVVPAPRVLYKESNNFQLPNGYLNELLMTYSGEESFEKYNIHFVDFQSIEDAFSFSNELFESGYVKYAHPDMLVSYSLFDDPLYSSQYQLNNNNDSDCDASEAWEISTGSPDIIVALFDSGGEPHEDLEDELGNSRVLPGFNDAWLLPEPGEDDSNWIYGAPNPINDGFTGNGHGMSCAGIVGASHNEMGIRGIAPHVKIMPVNIFYGMFLSDMGATVLAYYLAAEEGADVIGNSWGIGGDDVVWDALDEALSDITTTGRNGLGCVVVFASGNYPGGVAYPATHPDVIAVGATGPDGSISDYSQGGPELDLVAPSSATLSNGTVSTIDRMGALGAEVGNYTEHFGGTSAACPLVAGIAALVLSEHPEFTEEEVRELLYCSATYIGDPPTYGHGMVNAYNALIGCEAACNNTITFEETLLLVQGNNYTINSNLDIEDGIVIENATLTIAAGVTLRFGPNAKIIIKDGGLLNSQGGNVHLTNACTQMWQGIEVWDDPSVSGFGSINLVGVTIENAHFGVSLGCRKETSELSGFLDPDGTPNALYYINNWKYYCKHGHFSNCTFLNCAIGINIPGSPISFPVDGSDIWVSGNEFITYGDGLLDFHYGSQAPSTYPNVNFPWYAPSNSENRGSIGFRACGVKDIGKFLNNHLNNLEIGVKGINAYFHIEDSQFEYLQYGIQMEQAMMSGINLVHSLGNIQTQTWGQNIIGCTFSNIYDPNPADGFDLFTFPQTHQWFGASYNGIDEITSNTAAIRLDYMPDMKITDCELGVLEDIVDYDHNVNGVYLNNCTNFSIHNNVRFYGLKHGVIIIDSDTYWWGDNLIGSESISDIHNAFTDCLFDISSGRDNYTLMVRCNNIDHTNQLGTFWGNKGVLGNQGSDPEFENDATTGAGNLFAPNTAQSYITNAQRLIYSENSTTGGLYEDITINDVLSTELFTGNPIYWEGTEEEFEFFQQGILYYYHGIEETFNEFRPDIGESFTCIPVPLNIDYSITNSCDSPYNIIVGEGNNQVVYDNTADIASKLEIEYAKLTALEASLDNYHEATWDLLVAIYGGISNDYELKEYLKSCSPLSAEVLKAYMLRYNVPSTYFQEIILMNSIIDASLHDLFVDRTQSIPEAIKEQLRAVYLVNPNIQTVTKLRRRIFEYSKIYRMVFIKEVQNLLRLEEFEAAKAMLNTQSGPYPKMLLCDILIMEGKTSEAINFLNQWIAENDDIQEWLALRKYQILRLQQSEQPMMSDITNCLNLSEYNPSNMSSVFASSFLGTYGFSTPMMIPKPDPQPQERKFEYFSVNTNTPEIVYPNPTKDYLRVHLNYKGIVQFKLFDESGTLVLNEQINIQLEDPFIKLVSLAAGAYTYTIFTSSSVFHSGNLIINP